MLFEDEVVTKDQYEKTLRAYQDSQDMLKSENRDRAAKGKAMYGED